MLHRAESELHTDTVAMSSVQGVALTLDRLGVDSDAALREAGVAPTAISDVSGFLSRCCLVSYPGL